MTGPQSSFPSYHGGGNLWEEPTPEPDPPCRTAWLLLAFIAAVLGLFWLAVLCFTAPAHARDSYDQNARPVVCDSKVMPDAEWRACKRWIADIKKPDVFNEKGERTESCCGDADAYIADASRTEGDKLIAIITEDYPEMLMDDGYGGNTKVPGIPKGTEYEIPPAKMNPAYKDGGNPSGHGIVFIGQGGYVICYFGLAGG